ncbi:MAG: hypothetical protein AABZ74_10285 [Cyanobacteriota bacterium]
MSIATKDLHVKIDPNLYDKIRTLSFSERKSISDIVREGLEQYFNIKSQKNKDLELLLEEDDENRILEILQKNEIIPWSDVKKGYNLK